MIGNIQENSENVEIGQYNRKTSVKSKGSDFG